MVHKTMERDSPKYRLGKNNLLFNNLNSTNK